MSENGKSMQNGPKYNIRTYNNPKYDAFLQNKEFAEWFKSNFDASTADIVDAIRQFKIQMPEIELPELDITPLEEGLDTLNKNVATLIEAQAAGNDLLKQLIETMQHVAQVRKPRK